MSREKIRDSAGQAAGRLDDFPDIADNELRTKNSLIEPFLRSLGYDTTHPEQVTLEELTDLGGKIDYVLRGETRATIAVEAKRAGLKLSDKETKQLRSYFTFSAAVAGILTNGVDYWLFTDLNKPNVMDSQPYRRIDIRSITENDLSHLTSLARQEISQDGVHHQARNERYQSRINCIVAEELATPSQEFLRLVGRKAGIKPLNKTNLAFLRPLVSTAIARSLSAQPSSAEMHQEPQTNSGAAQPKTTPCSKPGAGFKADQTKKNFEGVTLFGNTLPAKNYKEVLVEVIKVLQARHSEGFDVRVKAQPFYKETRKGQYISTREQDFYPGAAKHKAGDHWVDTNLNAAGKVKRARLFLKEFGYDPDDLVIHTKGNSNPA